MRRRTDSYAVSLLVVSILFFIAAAVLTVFVVENG